MRKLFLTLFSAALLQAAALAADAGLLSLVMPDAKVIAGAQVDQAKTSPFGVYVLTHFQPDDKGFEKFITDTGFDPRRDVSEIVMASNGARNESSHWLVAAKGIFNPAKIEAVAQLNGGTITHYQGIDIITGTSDKGAKHASNTSIAFLDPVTAVMGDIAVVQAAIDRRKSNATIGTNLAGKVRQVSASNDFWFTTLVPLSEFATALPDPNMQGAMKGNLITAIQQASGGVKFGNTVQVYAEAVTRSEKDANALVDVVKFIAGLIQLNRDKDTTAAQVSTLLDNLQTSTNGNIMTMTLGIPEATLEQMIDSVHRQHAPKKSARIQ